MKHVILVWNIYFFHIPKIKLYLWWIDELQSIYLGIPIPTISYLHENNNNTQKELTDTC